MIDIRELRISSTVLCDGKRVKVEGVVIQNGIVFFENDNAYADMLDPIPLTPELVEEIGFEKGEESKESKIFYQDPICKKLIQKCQKKPELAKEFAEQTFCSLFHYENEEKKEVWLLICEKGQVYVSYLHELENMYHYLTGREL